VTRWPRIVLAAILLALAAPAGPAFADQVRDGQWQLTYLNMAQAWQVSQGEGVTVAVIDSGIDGTHPDLAGNVLQGTSLIPNQPGNGWADDFDHGTAMAGLIAAHGHGTTDGAKGIAPKARILPIRIGAGPNYEGPDVGADGIDFAIQHGARVISMSLTHPTGSIKVLEAVNRAEQADIVVVAAVGNVPESHEVACPACYDGVVAVGGTDRNGNHAAISVTGPQMVVSSPAVDVVTTGPHHGYHTGTGTSDATAITAGVVALIRARHPKLSATEVIHRLTATATDKGTPGRDDQYGYGIVNPYAALTATIPGEHTSPGASTSPATPGVGPDRAAPPTNKSSATPTVIIGVVALAIVALAIIAAGVVAVARGRRRHPAGRPVPPF
jgi:type VII secretion-associated serine protease mycosin